MVFICSQAGLDQNSNLKVDVLGPTQTKDKHPCHLIILFCLIKIIY
jgi:hypothetical protein